MLCQPLFLRRPKNRAIGIAPVSTLLDDHARAAATGRLWASLRRSVLTLIEHMNRQQIAELARHIKRHVRALRFGRQRQRHVLPIGLIGHGSTGGKLRLFCRVLRLQIRIVIVEFVIVMGDEPRTVCVRLL